MSFKKERKIYLVGGAVRDLLLDVEISDRDYVAIGYEADDFSHLRQVGKDFPVFILPDGNELALARVERKVAAGYSGFVMDTKDISLEDDLKRRDLTINSIAYDEESRVFIDPFGGRDDISKKILRHTSNAFVEDPIRVLRIARFRAKYGYEWKIHNTTKELISSMHNELKSLQKERIFKEVQRVMLLQKSYIFFETLLELEVLETIFESIYRLSIDRKNFKHAIELLKKLSNSSTILKFTALYYYLPNYDEPNIQLPNKIKKPLLSLINWHKKLLQLETLSSIEIGEFFASFKKDRKSLEDLITFYRVFDESNELDEPKIFKTFDAISSYSPKKWIDSQTIKPTAKEIQNHLKERQTAYVKEILIG